MDSSEALLSATRNPNVLASVANVPIEAAREALKRGLQLQRSEYLSCLKQQRVILERKMKAELKRRVEPAKPPQPETEKIQLRIQDLAKEIELLKQKVSNADDSMQNRVSQLTDTLDNIKTDAGEGKPSDAAEQTPDKAPVAASASEKTPDKAPAAEETPENAPPATTASALDQTPDKTPGGSESATPVEPVMTEDLPPVEELNVSLDEPLTVVHYQSEDEEEENEDAKFRERVKRFYAEFNPSKLHNVDRLLQTYRGREQELIVKLHQRYNVPFSRTNGAPPPPPVSPKEKEQSPAKPRSKSFARGMFNAVKTVFSKKKDRGDPSRNRAVSAGNPHKTGSSSARSRSDSSGSGKPKRINRAKSVTNNIAQWLMGKPSEGASESCLNELRKLRLEVQKYQEQEACLKQEAQTLRDVVRERDACHSSETESLKDVVKAMHDEMKRLCEENDSLKLQINFMREAGDAE